MSEFIIGFRIEAARSFTTLRNSVLIFVGDALRRLGVSTTEVQEDSPDLSCVLCEPEIPQNKIHSLDEIYGPKLSKYIARFNGNQNPLAVAEQFVAERYEVIGKYPHKQEVYNLVSYGRGNNLHWSKEREDGIKAGHSRHDTRRH